MSNQNMSQLRHTHPLNRPSISFMLPLQLRLQFTGTLNQLHQPMLPLSMFPSQNTLHRNAVTPRFQQFHTNQSKHRNTNKSSLHQLPLRAPIWHLTRQ